jgi:hypothetical protein
VISPPCLKIDELEDTTQSVMAKSRVTSDFIDGLVLLRKCGVAMLKDVRELKYGWATIKYNQYQVKNSICNYSSTPCRQAVTIIDYEHNYSEIESG